jgi:hypothetical protein
VYWQGDEHSNEKSQDYLECLLKRFGSDKQAECGTGSALIDADKLRDPSSFYMARTAQVAQRMMEEESRRVVHLRVRVFLSSVTSLHRCGQC